MPAYYRAKVDEFLSADRQKIEATLVSRYTGDGYFQLLGTQAVSWSESIPLLKRALSDVVQRIPDARDWGLLLEYPLYRLRRRIDLVLIARDFLFVVELKVGARRAELQDLHQAEEYALDLRDFHKASHELRMQPLLCCTSLSHPLLPPYDAVAQVQSVMAVSANDLAARITARYQDAGCGCGAQVDLTAWDLSPYEPVPSIIEAATTIFAGHSVRDIANAKAANLRECSNEVLHLIDEARSTGRKRLIVVTGVPGAGKTLAGLNITHGGVDVQEQRGEIIYLSGNTPLVLVIREALAQDEKARAAARGDRKTLKDIRHTLQARIQHINDFLKQYVRHEGSTAPDVKAIVFDEAQRAWDRNQGQKKFGRNASEPELLMEIMGRHRDWAGIVCLVGAGQEINTGEAGMGQWGAALAGQSEWEVIAPQSAIGGDIDTAGTALFPAAPPAGLRVTSNDRLRLVVPMRSYRSAAVSRWVYAVLDGDADAAAEVAGELKDYPITLARSIDDCRSWLRHNTRGERRSGLLASTSAVRLLADGLGATLTVQDGPKICHWYLQPGHDYRASNSLEVTANEYTCQGLEVDFAGVCWGGDFTREKGRKDWSFRKLRNTSWNHVNSPDIQRFIRNKYRVFLTRAREGLALFVPRGDLADNTRPPEVYNYLADYLAACGAQRL